MNKDYFKLWMQQPGLVKKLQGFLVLSIILNLFLFMQLIPDQTDKPAETQISQSQEQNLEKESLQSKITEEELRDFTIKYINNFFATNEESYKFIETFSSSNLFQNTLKTELDNRMELNLESEFKLDDILLESVSSNQAKALIIGREVFPKGDYESRSFTVELIINTETIQVESIPVFKVN